MALLSSTLAYQLAVKQHLFDAKYNSSSNSNSGSVGTTTAVGSKQRTTTVLAYEVDGKDGVIADKTMAASNMNHAISKVKLEGSLSNEALPLTTNESDVQEDLTKVNRIPKIYYCTRTHSQLRQIVQEFKNSHKVYRENVNFIVLGSRTHLCINGEVLGDAKRDSVSVDEVCKERLQNMAIQHLQPGLPSCHFMHKKRVEKTSTQIRALQVWDIEDAKAVGRTHHGCPYFGARALAEQADYYLAPYNYLISSSIRKAMRIDLKDAIVIFDEAHNIEDVARESASIELPFNTVVIAIGELSRLGNATQNNNCQKLLEFVMMFLLFSNEMLTDKMNLAANNSTGGAPLSANGHGNNGYSTPYQGKFKKSSGGFGADLMEKDGDVVWSGPDYLDIMKFRYALTEDTLKVYAENLDAMLGDEDDLEDAAAARIFRQQDEESNDGIHDEIDGNGNKKNRIKLSAGTIGFLRQMMTVLGYMLCRNRQFADDFQVLLSVASPDDGYNTQRSGKKQRGAPMKLGSEEYDNMVAKNSTLSIWCMQGGVVFQEITENTHSVLLASGTLSPLDSFAGELSTPFPIRVEANHVINLSNQLVVGMISQFRNLSYNSTYQAQQSDQYLDLLGETMYIAMKLTPGGVLMFLPSYALLNRLMDRWSKQPVRPGGNQGTDETLPRSLLQRIQDDLKARVFFEPKDTKTMNAMLNDYYHELQFPHSKAGMLAVCRGKVSEGINFSDHFARCVMVVGIPYPSLADKKVHLKRKYQDKKCSQVKANEAANLPNPFSYENGDGWYRQQAFRAINQAVGRCIRHRNDFGAIVLLDPRFNPNDRFVVNSLSRWMRSEAKVYDRFEDFVLPLQSFFAQHNSYGHIPDGGMDIEPLPVDDETTQNRSNTKKKKKTSSDPSGAEKNVHQQRLSNQQVNYSVKKEPPSKVSFEEDVEIDQLPKKRQTISITDAFAKVKESNRLKFDETSHIDKQVVNNAELGGTHQVHEEAMGVEDDADYGCIGFYIDREGDAAKKAIISICSEGDNDEAHHDERSAARSPLHSTEACCQSGGFSPVHPNVPIADCAGMISDAEQCQLGRMNMEIEVVGRILADEMEEQSGPFTTTVQATDHHIWENIPWHPALTSPILFIFEQKDIQLQSRLLGGGKKVYLTEVPDVFSNLQMAFEQGVLINSFPSIGISGMIHHLTIIPRETVSSPGLFNSGSVAAKLTDLPFANDLLQNGMAMVEHWDAADGAVFRYLCARCTVEDELRHCVIAAKVVATGGSDEQRKWLDHTFGNKALVAIMSKLQ